MAASPCGSSRTLCARLRAACRSRNVLKLSIVVGAAVTVGLLVNASGHARLSAWKHAKRAGVLQQSDWEFGGWKVKVGDTIMMDDTIAVLRDRRSGREKAVHAHKDGTVTGLHGYLQEGDLVDEHAVLSGTGTRLATIGKFIEPKLGFMEAAVVVPDTDVVFEYFLVKVGDWVNAGDEVAQVAQLRTEADTGRKLQAEFIKVRAPKSGHVAWLLPLRPGKISDQCSSRIIAKVFVAVPWWPPLLVALLTTCCCLVSLSQVMTDPKVAYETVPPSSARTCSMPSPPTVRLEHTPQEQASEMSSISEGPVGMRLDFESDVEVNPPVYAKQQQQGSTSEGRLGLRLDFESDGEVNSVYAKCRPLGIQHSSEAPCVVCGFTVNSYAEAELGVQKGWKLVRIGEECPNGSAAVRDELDSSMEELPVWPLMLEFKQSGGDLRLFRFNERPIGLELAQERNPAEVGRVLKGGRAEKAGVQKGWILTKIGNREVDDKQGFYELSAALEEAVNALDGPEL